MKNWTEFDLIKSGSKLIPKDPWLAQKIIAEGIKKSPYTSIAYIQLGLSLRRQRRPKEALRAYDLAKKVFKDEAKSKCDLTIKNI